MTLKIDNQLLLVHPGLLDVVSKSFLHNHSFAIYVFVCIQFSKTYTHVFVHSFVRNFVPSGVHVYLYAFCGRNCT